MSWQLCFFRKIYGFLGEYYRTSSALLCTPSSFYGGLHDNRNPVAEVYSPVLSAINFFLGLLGNRQRDWSSVEKPSLKMVSTIHPNVPVCAGQFPLWEFTFGIPLIRMAVSTRCCRSVRTSQARFDFSQVVYSDIVVTGSFSSNTNLLSLGWLRSERNTISNFNEKQPNEMYRITHTMRHVVQQWYNITPLTALCLEFLI